MNFKIKEIKELFKKGKRVLREEGFLSLLKKSLFSCSMVYLYEERLDNDVSVPPCKLDNLTIKPLFIPTMTQFEYEAPGEEFFDFPSHPDAQEYVPGHKEILNTGMLMLYVTANGEFVHRDSVCLSGRGNFYEYYYKKLQRKSTPPFYSLDDRQIAHRALCVTNPKYRNKGVFRHFYFEMHNFMRKEGFSKLVYTEYSDRIYLLKIVDELGAEAKFKVYNLKLLTLFNFMWLRPCTVSPLTELGISGR